MDSTIPLPLTAKISKSLQACLCRTWSEIPKTGFLVLRLILNAACLCPINRMGAMGCRFTIYSLLMDIHISFLDIQSSFLDIDNSFLDIHNSFLNILKSIYGYP